MATSVNTAEFMSSIPTLMFIDGKWVEAKTGKKMSVEDPSIAEPIATVPDCGPEDALLALDAAARAQSSFAKVPPRERSEILRRAYQAMVDKIETLAMLITLENGKPLNESRAEVLYAAEFFRWFSEEAVRIDGRYTVAPNGAGRILVTYAPVGPSLLITPWNFPAAMITRKAGAAIAAGCTMVVKPAEETPLTALLLAKILKDAGLPDGVMNVITTSDPENVVNAILNDFRCKKVSFTGSTFVGSLILEKSAKNIIKASMELGGNAPFIVCDDADLDKAVEGAMVAKLRNSGEACTAANRFYVARNVADQFSNMLAGRMSELKVGRGFEEGVAIGPLINDQGLSKVESMVQDMLAKGAEVVIGGEKLPRKGYFYAPTVVRNVHPESIVLKEEIFGPVAPIVEFDTLEEAIELANNTTYGLVAYAYTKDLRKAMELSEKLEYGMVGINTGLVSNPAAPFGGIKKSGIGREGGKEGVLEYLEVKYVYLNW